jgi:hypothetical protein
MWFQIGRFIDEIACVEDERLKTELVNRKWKIDKKGRRVVESKDDYKSRGFPSPDDADAFLLCFYNPYGAVEDVTTLEGEEERPSLGDQRMPIGMMRLHTEENARRFVELSKRHKFIDDIAREMGVEPMLLKQWVQMERDFITSVASGAKESDEFITI